MSVKAGCSVNVNEWGVGIGLSLSDHGVWICMLNLGPFHFWVENY